MISKKFDWHWLSLLFVGRVLTASTFFMYVGAMSFLIQEWEMNATNAGLIQSGHFFGLAGALFFKYKK